MIVTIEDAAEKLATSLLSKLGDGEKALLQLGAFGLEIEERIEKAALTGMVRTCSGLTGAYDDSQAFLGKRALVKFDDVIAFLKGEGMLLDYALTSGAQVEQGKPNTIDAAESAKPTVQLQASPAKQKRTRSTDNTALLNRFVADGIKPNIADVWLHITTNAGKEGFPIATASTETATKIDGKKVSKEQLKRALEKVRKNSLSTS